jgi:hypothetical protein
MRDSLQFPRRWVKTFRHPNSPIPRSLPRRRCPVPLARLTRRRSRLFPSWKKRGRCFPIRPPCPDRFRLIRPRRFRTSLALAADRSATVANPFASPLDPHAPQLSGAVAHEPDYRAPASYDPLNQPRPLSPENTVPAQAPVGGARLCLTISACLRIRLTWKPFAAIFQSCGSA